MIDRIDKTKMVSRDDTVLAIRLILFILSILFCASQFRKQLRSKQSMVGARHAVPN